MGPIVCPETSVRKYPCTVRDNADDLGYHLHSAGSLKLRLNCAVCILHDYFQEMSNFNLPPIILYKCFYETSTLNPPSSVLLD
jgi:hypothetical protein